MVNYQLVDIEKIEKWIEDIKNYDYGVLPLAEQRRHMQIILMARQEAYQNVLNEAVVQTH